MSCHFLSTKRPILLLPGGTISRFCIIANLFKLHFYMPNSLLKGKRGVIFGALDENSIAWKTAQKVKEEGVSFTLTNAAIAMRMGKINDLAKACSAEVIPADATSEQDLNNLFTKSTEILGGKLDFVLHSIGMSPNIRKGKEYGDMNYDWFLKTLDISALSFHKV